MVETSKTSFSQCINQIEEAFIAITLGMMTLVTLANVVARYIFNANLLWAVANV